MAHRHMHLENINSKKGFAALFFVMSISFALTALILTSHVMSFDSRSAFLHHAKTLEQESAANACLDLAEFATEKGDIADVIGKEIVLPNTTCIIE